MADFWKVEILLSISRVLMWFSRFSVTEPNAPMIIGTTFVVQFHILDISILRSVYFLILLSSLSFMFLSFGIATSIRKHARFFLIRMEISGLFAFSSSSPSLRTRSTWNAKSHRSLTSSFSTTFSGGMLVPIIYARDIVLLA